MGAVCGVSRRSTRVDVESATIDPEAPRIENNSVFFTKYDLDRSFEGKLGEGTYASVRLGTNKATGQVYAIKCVDKSRLDETDIRALKDEVSILKSVHHDNVMKLVEDFEEMDYFFLVTELVKGGELFDRIVTKECYSEMNARDLSRVLLETLAFLHDRCIVHRDLKPENLLLKTLDDDSAITLADFGYAARLSARDEKSLRDSCGTPGYVAPEILCKKRYGTKVDMWSCGVIIFILLGGYPPFGGDDHEMLQMIRVGKFRFDPTYWDSVSEEAKDLIKKLLTVDPDKRLSAAEALKHPWICETDDAHLASRTLDANLAAIKQYNAKRKLQRAVKLVILMNQLGRSSTHEGGSSVFLSASSLLSDSQSSSVSLTPCDSAAAEPAAAEPAAAPAPAAAEPEPAPPADAGP